MPGKTINDNNLLNNFPVAAGIISRPTNSNGILMVEQVNPAFQKLLPEPLKQLPVAVENVFNTSVDAELLNQTIQSGLPNEVTFFGSTGTG